MTAFNLFRGSALSFRLSFRNECTNQQNPNNRGPSQGRRISTVSANGSGPKIKSEYSSREHCYSHSNKICWRSTRWNLFGTANWKSSPRHLSPHATCFHSGGVPGGLGDETPVASNDTEIHKLVGTVKADAIKALQLSSNAALTPKSYSKQVVAGTNYFVKVDNGEGQCVVLKIFQDLPYRNKNASLTGTKQLTSCTDKISFF